MGELYFSHYSLCAALAFPFVHLLLPSALSFNYACVCVLMLGVITSAMIILFLLSITANTVNTGQFCP